MTRRKAPPPAAHGAPSQADLWAEDLAADGYPAPALTPIQSRMVNAAGDIASEAPDRIDYRKRHRRPTLRLFCGSAPSSGHLLVSDINDFQRRSASNHHADPQASVR